MTFWLCFISYIAWYVWLLLLRSTGSWLTGP